MRPELWGMDMKTLWLGIALLVLSSFAFGQAPVCDVTCAPDPNGAGYDNTVDAMTQTQNMRGNGQCRTALRTTVPRRS